MRGPPFSASLAFTRQPRSLNPLILLSFTRTNWHLILCIIYPLAAPHLLLTVKCLPLNFPRLPFPSISHLPGPSLGAPQTMNTLRITHVVRLASTTCATAKPASADPPPPALPLLPPLSAGLGGGSGTSGGRGGRRPRSSVTPARVGLELRLVRRCGARQRRRPAIQRAAR